MFLLVVSLCIFQTVMGRIINRIIGGIVVDETDPITKSIVRLRTNGQGFCGGTIIGSTLESAFILTAAHCLSMNPQNLEIEFQGVAYPVQSYRIHEKYSSSSNSNDIAFIITKGPLPFNDVIPALLDGTFLANPYQCEANGLVVAGWGVTNITNPNVQSKKLMRAIVPVYNQQACQRVYPSVSMYNICAGYKNGEKDSCYGDSGGPLYFYQGVGKPIVLEGIVSYGRKCGLANFPGVYVRVSSYIGWIREQVRNWNEDIKIKEMMLMSETLCITKPPSNMPTTNKNNSDFDTTDILAIILNISSSIVRTIVQERG